jgi:hypothetical protein
MNYLDLLGSKFVFCTLGLVAVACGSAGDPVSGPPHGTGSGSSGSLNVGSGSGSGSGGSSSNSSGTSSGTGNPGGTGGSGSGTAGSSGGNNVGTAGTSGTGGSTGAAGSSGGVTPVAVDSTFAMNGYGDNGTWKGYAFTSTFPPPPAVTTAMITPACPTPCFASAVKQLCVSGTVRSDMSFGSGATLGWNINQAAMMPNPVQTMAPTGSGLTVNVPGATATMRVQISAGPAPTTQWCAPMPAGGMGTIKWTAFKTKCWDGSGTAYPAGTPIEAIQIVVPSATTDVPFAFCLASASIAP